MNNAYVWVKDEDSTNTFIHYYLMDKQHINLDLLSDINDDSKIPSSFISDNVEDHAIEEYCMLEIVYQERISKITKLLIKEVVIKTHFRPIIYVMKELFKSTNYEVITVDVSNYNIPPESCIKTIQSKIEYALHEYLILNEDNLNFI